MRFRLLATAAAVLPALALAACGSSGGTPATTAVTPPSAVQPRPEGVQDPAVLPSASPAPPSSCDPVASFRPPASLPAPGRMPTGSAMARIVQRGRLVVGVSQNAYLFGYRDPATGDLVGFDIDIAREMARALFGDPNKIQLRAIATADRIPMIRSGAVDLVVRQTTMTCQRWQDVSFSSEYYSASQRVLVLDNSPVKGMADLAGKKVCAAAGSTSIANIAAKLSGAVPVSGVDASDCLVLLQQGQIEAISTDDAILAGFAAQDPNTHLVPGPAISAEPYGIMVAKGSPELVRFVNGVLERLRVDGTWSAIYRRWLSSLGAAAPPAARYQD
jgi:polar amino acid transport system substrate-binding protein